MGKETTCTHKKIDYKYVTAHTFPWFKEFASLYRYDEMLTKLEPKNFKGYIRINFDHGVVSANVYSTRKSKRQDRGEV